MPVIRIEGSKGDLSERKEGEGNRGLTTHGEKLVQSRDDDGIEDTQNPHAERIDVHGGVIDARYSSTNFRVRRFAVK
jgi:hypothetical protein